MATKKEMEALQAEKDAAVEEIAELKAQIEADDVGTEDELKALTLRQKLHRAQTYLCTMGVSKTATGSQYATRSIDVLIGVMSTTFAKHRIHLTPNIINVERSTLTTKAGSVMFHSLVCIEYGFLDVDGDEKIATTFYGEAADSLDKSLQKAVTNAYKYLMIQEFQIPLKPSEDPDMYQTSEEQGGDDSGVESVEQKGSSKPQQQKPATASEPKITGEDLANLRKLIEAAGENEPDLCKKVRIEKLEDLPLARFAGACEYLNAAINAAQQKANNGGKTSGPRDAAGLLEEMAKKRSSGDADAEYDEMMNEQNKASE